MINLQLINSTKELESFPITQSLFLKSDVKLNESSLSNHIILFRLIPENGLISLAEPYTYSLGYIREKFSTIDLEFKQEAYEDMYKITVKPKTILSVDSEYILYVTDGLMNSRVEIDKTSSKSQSTLSAEVLKTTSVDAVSTVIVKTTSKLTDSSNITVFTIDGIDRVLDLKSINTYTTNYFKITLPNTVYVAGESFTIKALQDIDTEGMMYKFKTSPSTSIKPIETQSASTTINTQQVLDFYSKVNTIKQSEVLVPKYIGMNTFSVTLPEGFTIDTSRDIVVSIKEAFNNYLLSSLELYEQKSYTIYMYQDGDELFFEVIYSEDEETSVKDDEENDIPFKVKRIRR